MISVLDYGLGNVGSIINAFRYLNIPAKIASTAKDVALADRLIIPGVGAFDAGMFNLESLGLIEPIKVHAIDKKRPILGICLGMQLLLHSSEEGKSQGLGLLPGHLKNFCGQVGNLSVPHVGWNTVEAVTSDPLFREICNDPNLRFYFCHSFFADIGVVTSAKAQYGVSFSAALNSDNIWGVQFHPEKSHRFGLALLKNFSGL